jgi:hypothetical protein
MVLGIVIATQGTFSDVSLPAKTVDVLEWLRKKLKAPGLQFQGKLVTEDVSYAVFATPADEGDSQHILPPPFSDDSFQGSVALLKTRSENADEYDKPASAYEDFPIPEYEAYYASVSFESPDEEEAVEDAVEDAVEEAKEAGEAEVEEAEEVVPVEVVPEVVPMIDITHPDFRTAPGIEAPVEPEVPEVPDGPREERGPMEEPELRLPGGGAVRLMAGPSALLDR